MLPESEFAFIRWLRSAQPRASIWPALTIPLGDDCAGLDLAGRGEVLITTDIRLDGVHFLSAQHTPELIARKALACSLSDIAAMAAVPVGAVAAVALPRQRDPQLARRLSAGMIQLADEFDCPLIGGDTTTWAGPLTICVTCLGVSDGIAPRRRSTATVGELLFVTGRLGGSMLGHHLTFTPRVREARLLAGLGANAMMDLSDGLAGDLRHVCELSGVSAELDEAALAHVASDAARQLSARDGRSVVEHACSDGEDFELLFTASATSALAQLSPAARREAVGVDVAAVGRIVTAGAARIRWVRVDGRVEPLPFGGYEH